MEKDNVSEIKEEMQNSKAKDLSIEKADSYNTDLTKIKRKVSYQQYIDELEQITKKIKLGKEDSVKIA